MILALEMHVHNCADYLAYVSGSIGEIDRLPCGYGRISV